MIWKCIKLMVFFFVNLNAFIFTHTPSINSNKLLTVGPGGLTGFYNLGVASYLKENYNLTEYVFLGASAGSWNALLLTYKNNYTEVIDNILAQEIYYQTKSIPYLLNYIKDYIEKSFKEDDFELNKLYVSVSTFKLFSLRARIIQNFTSLTDATNGCYYSSYIPFLTGKVKFFSFKNLIFDGGIFAFPPKHIEAPYFDIHTGLWGRQFNSKDRFLYPDDPEYIKNMYRLGYNDSHKNRLILDKFFVRL